MIPRDWPIVLAADDTIERRSGRRIKAKGCYRDPVRSSRKHVVKCFGLKWVALMVLKRESGTEAGKRDRSDMLNWPSGKAGLVRYC